MGGGNWVQSLSDLTEAFVSHKIIRILQYTQVHKKERVQNQADIVSHKRLPGRGDYGGVCHF